MSAPLVSVIVPAYEAATRIAAAIGSALAQSLAELEVVVADDASRDDTAGVVLEMARRDPRVRLLRAEVNGGPARARNRAIAAARGTWIAPLDADDAYQPRRLERLLAVATTCRADLVADNLRLVDGASGRDLGPALPEDRQGAPEIVSATRFVRANLHDGFSWGYLKPLIRRALLDRHGIRYREFLRIGEDYALDLDCLLAGARFALTREPLYDYHLTPGSISRRLEAAHIRALCALNREHLAAAGDHRPGLVVALWERQAMLERMLGHVRFVERVKAGRIAAAMAVLMRRPAVVPLVLRYGRESLLKRLGLLGFHGRRI
jgi:succinoglycan biosynthesis protein ExoO